MERAKKKKHPDDEPREANLIPIMSCLMLLIPALLLAMEIGDFAAIDVRPPMFVDEARPANQPPPEQMRFSVFVASDRIVAKVGDEGPGRGQTEFPTRSGEPDYAALTAHAKKLKALHPQVARVELSAEGDIPLQTIVATMDALRGRSCEFGAVGERPGDECLFWDVVVTGM